MAQKRRRQHSKGKHRPRAWHMGQKAGRENERVMVSVVEPAFAAAAADHAEGLAVAEKTRAELRDWNELVAGLVRVPASCALAPLPERLLV